MLLTVIFAMALGKIRHYKIKYLFYSWTTYPILLAEIMLFILQMMIFAGNYTYLSYTEAVRIIHTFSYLFACCICPL
jgi:hypothetical protein